MLELRQFRLEAGDTRRVDVPLELEPVILAGNAYQVEPSTVTGRLELQATPDGLYLHLRFQCEIAGPCFRCLDPARAAIQVDATEYHEHAPEPGTEDETTSDYLDEMTLDIERWARDAMVLGIPGTLLCQPDCRGLCPVCGANLNGELAHQHDQQAVDQRWAKLRELGLNGDTTG